jgi:hypothetical protein
MRTVIRAGTAGITAAVALAVAGSALGAVNPQLTIGTSPGSHRLSIAARVGTSDDAIARMQLYVPSGFKLKAPAGGKTVGTVSATALSLQIGPGEQIPFKMTGEITAIGTTDPAVSWENAHCDTSTHLAAWMAEVHGGGDAWSFPIFVDATTGSETQFGAYKLVACFKPTTLDPYGNKFVSTSLTLDVFTAPRSGTHRWRALLTPFTAVGSEERSDGAGVEAQSVADFASSVLTLTARRAAPKTARFELAGRLLVGGEAFRGATVVIAHGKTAGKLFTLSKVKTGASGGFARVIRLASSQYVRAGTTLGGTSLGASACTASFGLPCLSATAARVAISSQTLHLAR